MNVTVIGTVQSANKGRAEDTDEIKDICVDGGTLLTLVLSLSLQGSKDATKQRTLKPKAHCLLKGRAFSQRDSLCKHV